MESDPTEKMESDPIATNGTGGVAMVAVYDHSSSVTIIRDATADEREAIRELTLRAYAEYAEIMEPASWSGLSHALREALASEAPVERLVADHDGQIIGSAMLFAPETDAYGAFVSASAAPEIRLVAVAPEARGRGVAKMLVEECIRRARERGASEVGLHTSRSMQAAMAMYAALGFVRAPERDFQPPGAELVEGYRLPFE
jgi:GNAT superfamily N-acetyltransferase